MAMVKASSYGSGGYEIANVLQDKQVDYLTVAYVDEGVALRKSGISLPIMVMSPSTEAFERMIVWKLEPELFNMRSVKQFVAAAESMGAHNYPVHIKLDTGMHRLGFMADEILLLIETLKQTSTLYIASIFSHLAASDDALHEDFTHAQAALFEQMSNQVMASLSYRPLRHLCNTAGIVRYPQYHFDMVRLGLGLYGIDASRGLEQQLQPISTLRTTIAQIKDIPEGETIGYSRRGKAIRPLRIATICIGYADGYPRALSKSDAYVLIHNKPARLIGAIAMDMCMVDITDIEGVQEGDEVIVFGDTLPIQQVAEWAGTIAYEIMTGISQRVKRVYVNET
jgi:alanine racemase